jgi:hypothetical protein
MSTYSFSTIPEALLFTSTFVIGWIWPVATTDRVTSPRVTFAHRFESMDEPFTIRANAMPPATNPTIKTTPTLSQIQNRLPLRDAATSTSLTQRKPEPSQAQ